MTPEGESDRRAAPRRALRRPAKFLLPGPQSLDVRTLDISVGGLAVVAPANPPVGMACTIQLAIPASGAAPYTLETRVKVTQSLWSTTDNGFKVGLQFLGLSAADLMAIRSFLQD